MSNLSPPQWLSFPLAVATFLLGCRVALEFHITPKDHKNLYIFSAIVAVALCGLYLFAKGQTLPDRKDRVITLYLSFGMSILFLVYTYIIWRQVKFEGYLLTLFILLTLSANAAEWVYSKEEAYKLRRTKDKTKKRFKNLRQIVKRLEAQIKKQSIDIKEALTTLAVHEDEIIKLREETEKGKKLLPYKEAGLNDFYINNEGAKYKICPNCFSQTFLPSNRSTELICKNTLEGNKVCNTIVWTKLGKEVEV